MFATNGRVRGSKAKTKARASITGKEFVCAACGKRKRVTNVEFGEQIKCDCGDSMFESYEQ